MDTYRKYFPDLSESQILQLNQLKDLYFEWNSKINVVSRKDIDQLPIRHVMHSLAIAKFIDFQPGTKVLDLGTGGGFPGVPLAIMFPDVEFLCIDSIEKKTRVVREVSKALGLKNISSRQQRVETLTERFDFIVSRAVARCKQLHEWTGNKFKKESFNPLGNGYILLKGGDLEEEIIEFAKSAKMDADDVLEIPLTSFFEEDFFETKKLIYIPKHA